MPKASTDQTRSRTPHVCPGEKPALSSGRLQLSLPFGVHLIEGGVKVKSVEWFPLEKAATDFPQSADRALWLDDDHHLRRSWRQTRRNFKVDRPILADFHIGCQDFHRHQHISLKSPQSPGATEFNSTPNYKLAQPRKRPAKNRGTAGPGSVSSARRRLEDGALDSSRGWISAAFGTTCCGLRVTSSAV